MEELEIRIWHKSDRVMLYPMLNPKNDDDYGIASLDIISGVLHTVECVNLLRDEGEDAIFGLTPMERTEYELMLYTGLKDSNGVKIFEGDIVVFENQKTYEVVGGDGCFMLSIIPDAHSQIFIDNDNCKVIGNIYDNPELHKE